MNHYFIIKLGKKNVGLPSPGFGGWLVGRKIYFILLIYEIFITNRFIFFTQDF